MSNGSTLHSVEIGEAVIYQRLKDEAVLLDLGKQTFYGLDPVATEMWELLLQHRDVETVIAKLKSIYEADESQIRQDLNGLIGDMVAAQLLKMTQCSLEGGPDKENT